MPLYEIYHSFPLTGEQRQAFAKEITNLHCAAFTTPSFFVHVRFVKHDANDSAYFTAGRPRTTNSNRVIGIVRTSSARPKEAFDALAAKIEDSWYGVLGTSGPHDCDETERLLMVTFTPMVSICEGGMTIPEAGKEAGWLREQLPFIKEMSTLKGWEDFGDMLKELEEREDLRKLVYENGKD